MSEQLSPLLSQRRHWYANATGSVETQDPVEAVSVLPSCDVPPIAGGEVLLGGGLDCVVVGVVVVVPAVVVADVVVSEVVASLFVAMKAAVTPKAAITTAATHRRASPLASSILLLLSSGVAE
jgi:hypothetical protein